MYHIISKSQVILWLLKLKHYKSFFDSTACGINDSRPALWHGQATTPRRSSTHHSASLHPGQSPRCWVSGWSRHSMDGTPGEGPKRTPSLGPNIPQSDWMKRSLWLPGTWYQCSYHSLICHRLSHYVPQRSLTGVPFPWIQNFYQYTTRCKKCKNLGPTSFSTELLNIAHLHFLLQLSDRHVWCHFQTGTFATQQFHLDPHHGGHGLRLRKSWTTHCEERVCPKMGGYPRY